MTRTTIHPAQTADASLLDGADRWPEWAVPQVLAAVTIAERLDSRRPVAAELYQRWFSPALDVPMRAQHPLAGVYRTAHAGSARRRRVGSLQVVDRNDTVGRDGWWRTWGTHWLPTRSRDRSVRLVLTPRPDALAEFVATATARLIDSDLPWLLALSTDPRRVRRVASAALYLPHLATLSPLAVALEPLVVPVTPPLCIEIAPGIATAGAPDNGMSFGEHRSHLIALALASSDARLAPLHAVADVFARYGIDSMHPHRYID